jgi:protein O-GlcNAc transferase
MSTPSSPASPLFEQARGLHQSGRLQEACTAYRKVLARNPRHVQAALLLATAVSQLGELGKAISLYGKVIALQADNAAAFEGRGNAMADLGRFSEALADYDKAIELSPHNPDIHCARSVVLHALGRYAEALQGFDRAVAIDQNFTEAWSNRGNTLLALKRPQEALCSFDRAIACRPDYAEAHSNRGVALTTLERTEEALQSIERAIALQPEGSEAWLNRGNALDIAGRLEDALRAYDRALELRPDYAAAHFNRGLALHRRHQINEACASYEAALAINQDYPEALCHMGSLLSAGGRYPEAADYLTRALRLFPEYPEAHANLASVFLAQGDLNRAGLHLNHALTIAPDLPSALINRATLSAEQGQHEAALNDLKRIVSLNPEHPYAMGLELNMSMRLCDWKEFDAKRTRLESLIKAGRRVSPPLVTCLIFGDPALHREAASIFVEDMCRPNPSLGEIARCNRKPGERLRVGYFSSDFRNHAVGLLSAELFELHNRNRFEIIGFDFGPNSEDPLRNRIIKAFDRVVDLRSSSDDEAAKIAREIGLHVAVDLNGHTLHARTGIFARRVAPIQVSYLGYPASTGASYIDYVFADSVVMPSSVREHFCEAVAYLPKCFQINDRKRQASDRRFTRSELGLPDDGFVFCCFNNSFKLAPQQFQLWIQILRRVESSVLWLVADNELSATNLRRSAESQGVAPNRLIFSQRRPVPDYLAQYRFADLFLDCQPYNAGTTASDALWMGVPVLTRRGTSYAGLMSASLLLSVGLGELIAESDQHYCDIASELATKPSVVHKMRDYLKMNRDHLPLFDSPRTVAHIESAYQAMVERYENGLQPEDIRIVG